MMKTMLVFKDRLDAGSQLAENLKEFEGENTCIFALPRGGVPVAYKVYKKIGGQLDVAVVRKLGVPRHEEFAFGAIAPNNIEIINKEVIKALDLSEKQIDKVKEKEFKELKRRLEKYRNSIEYSSLNDKTALIIDDGIATGSTMKAAIEFIKSLKPKKLIVAVPVSSKEAADNISSLVDEFFCLNVPSVFNAVGEWYENFSQTSDDEVIEYLKK